MAKGNQVELIAVISRLQTSISINACCLQLTPYLLNCTIVDTLPLIQTASEVNTISSSARGVPNINNEDNFDFGCSNPAWWAGVHPQFSLFFVEFVNKTGE